MNITIVGVGPCELIAIVNTRRYDDRPNGNNEYIVLVDRGTANDQYVVWRLVEEAPSSGPIDSPEKILFADTGQYYSDRSQALGRWLRRSQVLDMCDLPGSFPTLS